MKKHLFFPIFMAILSIFLYAGCSKNDITGNQAPKAHAGSDRILIYPEDSIVLNGSLSSDPDGSISSWQWKKIAGPSLAIDHPLAAQTKARYLQIGFYQFELTVTDDKGLLDKDTVAVQVRTSNVLLHWINLPAPPHDYFHAYLGVHKRGNYLLAVGQKIFAFSTVGNVFEFNAQNAWINVGIVPEINVQRFVFAAEGKGYYVVNGHLWQIDPNTYQWTRKNDPPDISVPLLLDNKAYFIGANNKLLMYNAAGDSFTEISVTPPGYALSPAFVVKGVGYFISSEGHLFQFGPGTGVWTEVANFPLASRVGIAGGFSTLNYGYLIGELDGLSYNNNEPLNVWRYDPVQNNWIAIAEDYPGLSRLGISTISLNGVAYLGFGDNNGDFHVGDFWKFIE